MRIERRELFNFLILAFFCSAHLAPAEKGGLRIVVGLTGLLEVDERTTDYTTSRSLVVEPASLSWQMSLCNDLISSWFSFMAAELSLTCAIAVDISVDIGAICLRRSVSKWSKPMDGWGLA